MKSRWEIEQYQNHRDKEREIRKFNEQLKDHAIFDDEAYINSNMSKIRINLKDFPEKARANPLLINEFFKTQRSVSDFKYINKELLENEVFISNAINSNPEIYLILSDKNKAKFKKMAINNDLEYLKYLTKEDYLEPEMRKKVINELPTFTSSLKCITDDIFKGLMGGTHSNTAANNILEFSMVQCKILKKPLLNYLKRVEAAFEKENSGINKLCTDLTKKIEANPNFFTVLDAEMLYNEKMKDFYVGLVGRHNNLFQYMPSEWRNDIDVILRVVNNVDDSEKGYSKNSTKIHPNQKNIALILNKIDNPDKFIERVFDKLPKEAITTHYTDLSKELRANETIIRSIFKGDYYFTISLEYCRSVPDEELSNKLIEVLKEIQPADRFLKFCTQELYKTVEVHYITKHLGKIPSASESLKGKSNKI